MLYLKTRVAIIIMIAIVVVFVNRHISKEAGIDIQFIHITIRGGIK